MWLRECPVEFKPLIYKRYVDDTFMLFKKEEHIDLFYNYLNNKHSKITFTIEKERDNKLPFLDLLISKTNNKIDTSIYRKETFTGLGINYLSACYEKYKTNAILTLLHRAYSLSSNYVHFNRKVEFLQNIFLT